MTAAGSKLEPESGFEPLTYSSANDLGLSAVLTRRNPALAGEQDERCAQSCLL